LNILESIDEKTRRVVLVALIVFLTWLVFYIFNSINGGYSLKPITVRKVNPNGEIGYGVFIVWRPLFGRFKDGNADFFGFLFSPLIVADRYFVHTSIDLIDPEGYASAQGLRASQLHPDERANEVSHGRQP